MHPNHDSFLICPKCTSTLDLNCYPKCILCHTLKQCIDCTQSGQILAVDYLVFVICFDCLATFHEEQINGIAKHLSIKKADLVKRIMALKQRHLKE